MLWFLSIEIWNSKIDGIYTVFYRSPKKDVNLENSLNALDESFDKVINLNKLNLITGDLNINLNKLNNKYAKISKNIFTKHDLKITANFITRENNNDGTLIDMIVSNKPEIIECKSLDNEIISDHKTISIKINEISEEKPNRTTVISWKNYTKERLLLNLSKCDWSLFHSLSLNDKITLNRMNLMTAVIPLTNTVRIKNNIKPKPWFDDDLKNLKIEKINKYMMWKSDKTEINWRTYTAKRNEYQTIRIKKGKLYER